MNSWRGRRTPRSPADHLHVWTRSTGVSTWRRASHTRVCQPRGPTLARYNAGGGQSLAAQRTVSVDGPEDDVVRRNAVCLAEARADGFSGRSWGTSRATFVRDGQQRLRGDRRAGLHPTGCRRMSGRHHTGSGRRMVRGRGAQHAAVSARHSGRDLHHLQHPRRTPGRQGRARADWTPWSGDSRAGSRASARSRADVDPA